MALNPLSFTEQARPHLVRLYEVAPCRCPACPGYRSIVKSIINVAAPFDVPGKRRQG